MTVENDPGEHIYSNNPRLSRTLLTMIYLSIIQKRPIFGFLEVDDLPSDFVATALAAARGHYRRRLTSASSRRSLK